MLHKLDRESPSFLLQLCTVKQNPNVKRRDWAPLLVRTNTSQVASIGLRNSSGEPLSGMQSSGSNHLGEEDHEITSFQENSVLEDSEEQTEMPLQDRQMLQAKERAAQRHQKEGRRGSGD